MKGMRNCEHRRFLLVYLDCPLLDAGAGLTWLMWTVGTVPVEVQVWLGELGRDLHWPMDSCCFLRVATIFWATAQKETG